MRQLAAISNSIPSPHIFPVSAGQASPRLLSISFSTRRFSVSLAMNDCGAFYSMPRGVDATEEEEHALQSNLLQDFFKMSTIENGWIIKSNTGQGSKGMFSINQPNLLGNKMRKFVLSCQISKESCNTVNFEWSPFPVEMIGVSTIIPSPSGSKLLIIRNPENGSPTQFEIWSALQLEKEFQIPKSVHGSVYIDGWFEGIAWNCDENLIAYVAEESSPPKPTFDSMGYKKGGSMDKDWGTWKGQGEWEEHWGETYVGKRQPALYVINICSGEVRAVEGISKTLSVGQVVWGPSIGGLQQHLVFVGWSSNSRKLGMKYCYNRACALYAIKAPFSELEANTLDYKGTSTEDSRLINLTQSISSAFFPRFSPDGKFLVFLSAKGSVDTGVHSATDSLHRIDWPADGNLSSSLKIVDVVPVVMCPDGGGFPGLYCSNYLSTPWLSDNVTVILSSAWYSTQVLLSVDLLSGKVSRITPFDSDYSWNVLALDGNHLVAVCSSPVDPPQINYGCFVEKESSVSNWSWLDVSIPFFKPSDRVRSLLSSLRFRILKIPIKGVSGDLSIGSRKPFEAIFVSSDVEKTSSRDPMIVIIHGGPHSVSLLNFSRNVAFLSSIGYSLLIVNYRGSLGFGEEALQSLPGNIGFQDVNDVLTAVDHVIDMGLADPSKVSLLGGSHGGFLTTHLIGQAPDKFAAAAVRNPVCNIALMAGTTDIPDWCYVEAYGVEGKAIFTEATVPEHLAYFYGRSPISHLSKVKTPTLFLLGAKDLRVPVSNGLQYARALKEKGVAVKVIVFPEDVHSIERPQSDFESFLNIGVWFKKFCK